MIKSTPSVCTCSLIPDLKYYSLSPYLGEGSCCSCYSAKVKPSPSLPYPLEFDNDNDNKLGLSLAKLSLVYPLAGDKVAYAVATYK